MESPQTVQAIPEVSNQEVPKPIKQTKAFWEQVKLEYQAGTYSSLESLAQRFSISSNALRSQIFRNKWAKQAQQMEARTQQIIEKSRDKMVQEYLQSSFTRARRYEKLIDKSIEAIGDTIDPDAIDTYTKAEARIHEMAKSSLRIAPVAQAIEHTGKLNMNIEHSLVSAIAKLREGGSMGDKLPSNLADRLIDIEVIDPSK